MTHETAGDPVSGLKWTRRTTAKLADELRGLGIHVCPQTVARLLKAMGYSLRVNHKKLAGASHPNRDQQFQHITALRERCAADNSPLISVDTKKKELVGTFRNPGAKWDRSPELVNDHDFRSDADGRAVPYGIYDPRANAGTVFVGRTADTPAFAVDCIEKWWRTEGRKRYPEAKTLQISLTFFRWSSSMPLSRKSCSRRSAFEPPRPPLSRAMLHVSAHAHPTCTALHGFSRLYPVTKDKFVMRLRWSLHQMLQVLQLNMFERRPLQDLFTTPSLPAPSGSQLSLAWS